MGLRISDFPSDKQAHIDDHRALHERYNAHASVLDFGAVGDGQTDDTKAIQAALDAASGDAIYIPDGVYRCGELSFGNAHLIGAGAYSTRLVSVAGKALATIESGTRDFIGFEGIAFSDFQNVLYGKPPATLGRVVINKCEFSRCHSPIYWQAALDSATVTQSLFEDCTGYNVLLGHQTEWALSRNIVVSGNQFLRPQAGKGYSACVLTYGQGIVIEANTATDLGTDRGFYSKGSSVIMANNAIHSVSYDPTSGPTTLWNGFVLKAEKAVCANNTLIANNETDADLNGVIIQGHDVVVIGNYLNGCRAAGIRSYTGSFNLGLHNNTIVTDEGDEYGGYGIRLGLYADEKARWGTSITGNIISGYAFPVNIAVYEAGKNLSITGNHLANKEAGYPYVNVGLYAEGIRGENIAILANLMEPDDDPAVWLTNLAGGEGVTIEGNTDNSYLIRESV